MVKKIGRPFIGDYPISDYFGWRADPNKKGRQQYHYAVDFKCPIGTKIRALEDGEIVLAYRKRLGREGLWIVQKFFHNNIPHFAIYCHLSRLTVEYRKNGIPPYQKVAKGELIAYSGDTGNVTGPCLHLGVCKNNVIRTHYKINAIDPLKIMEGYAEIEFKKAKAHNLIPKNANRDDIITYEKISKILYRKDQLNV